MGRRSKQTFLQRRYTDGQQTQNNNGVQPHPALAQQQPNKLQQMRAQRQKNIETELFKAGLNQVMVGSVKMGKQTPLKTMP